MKHLLLACALIAFGAPSQAQLLKKLKDKVNKTLDKATGDKAAEGDETPSAGKASASSGSRTNESSGDSEKQKWCDTVKATGTGADGIAYSLVYSSTGKMNIVYNESSLGLGNNKNGYRLILSERVNGKTQFVVVENGKVVDTDTKVKSQYLGKGVSSGFSVGNPGEAREEEMKKYLVADSVKHNIPKTSAKSAKINKVDDNQFEMALSMARQTEEYKNMTDEEKKEFEEMMKKGVAQNNAMAGQTISIPGQEGGSFSSVSGYRLVVKGKSYGKFAAMPAVNVSGDETNVFAVGVDENHKPVMIANGKTTALDKSKYSAMSGKIIRSPDLKKWVYVEQKRMSDEEMQHFYSSNGNAKMSYNILKPDGTGMLVTDHTNSGKFLLANNGAIINVNEQTAEVYADNKRAGKFKIKEGYSFDGDALLLGSDITKIAYYDGAEGSINYLDGTVRKLGILYPTVISENGKNYLSWFRKCDNDIYLAKFAY